MARVLGIDPGAKRVGIAVSDPTGTVAQPLSWIAAEPEATLVERLTSVAAERALISTGETRARRRQLSDQVAAALLLQGHLDSRTRRGRV